MNEDDRPASLKDLPEGAATSRTPHLSRWWYWIVAYPVFSLLTVPLAVFGLLLFAPLGAVTMPTGTTPEFVGPVAYAIVTLVVGAVAVYALVGVVLTVMLPVALYIDADELTDSSIEWSPDPILYGLIGLLNFLAAPVVGIIIATYYLYRRHQFVGTP